MKVQAVWQLFYSLEERKDCLASYLLGLISNNPPKVLSTIQYLTQLGSDLKILAQPLRLQLRER